MKKIVKKIFNLFGYEIKKSKNKKTNIPVFYNDFGYNLGYDREKEADKLIRIIRKNTMLPYVNLLTLFEQVVFCEKSNIEGDYVECGVWKGGAIGLMALTNLTYGSKRRNLHLFDAFNEICAPDSTKDGKKAIKEVQSILGKNAPVSGEKVALTGFYDCFGGPGTIEENKELLENKIQYPSEYIYYHKGWFQDTIPASINNIEKIAILRLDGDWYESTKVCLENLYDKVVKRGFVIIDDYGCYEGCKKAVDEFMKLRNINVFINYSSYACRYWIKY